MNRIYKIVWSKTRHVYVVTSEIVRSHVKGTSGKMAVAVAVGFGVFLGGYTANAADTAVGAGSGVAYGTGSSAPHATNIAIGNGAVIQNYINQTGSIAIGQNAKVINFLGGSERSFDFNQSGFPTFWGIPYGTPAHPEYMSSGIAIGQNTFARSGSVMLGNHNYSGTIGDITVDRNNTQNQSAAMYATTIGDNSYGAGYFSSVNGAFSAMTSAYLSYPGNQNHETYASQNFGATITGSLNTIESQSTGNRYAGVANSIVGLANKTANTNGALIFGAGNQITNSITTLTTPSMSGSSARDLQSALINMISSSNGSGATVAIGGGNRADYTQASQLMGVQNTLTGSSGSISRYNLLDGYKNTGTNVNHLTVIGSENTISNETSDVIIGDNHTLAGTGTNNIIIGTADTAMAKAALSGVSETVSIGHNSIASANKTIAIGTGNTVSGANSGAIGDPNIVSGVGSYVLGNDNTVSTGNTFVVGNNVSVTTENSVFLGNLSAYVASGSTTKGIDSTYTQETVAGNLLQFAGGGMVNGVVSIGSSTGTRRIQNVAPGLVSAASTDAINGSQLYAAAVEAGKHTTVVAGDYVTVADSLNTTGGKEYTITGPQVTSTDGTVTVTDKMVSGRKVGYDLSVNATNLHIADMHVRDGVTTYNASGVGTVKLTHQDGNIAYITGLKDTTLKAASNALSLSGNVLSLNVEDTSGKMVTGSVNLSSIASVVDTNTTYTMTGAINADNTTTISLNGSDGAVNSVTVATRDTRNTVKAGANVSLTETANALGGTEYTVNVKGDGKVEPGETKLVSGNTVYQTTHVKNDGVYVRENNSAGENLTALDRQVSKITNNIINLGSRINKVGAGAAALAALHPLDFDPNDKWNIAAGFGNYKNESAVAIGFFYRPNERTMLSVGATAGDDRNLFNAGLSIKLGKGNVYAGYSKVEMVNRIQAQDKKIEELKARDAKRDEQMKEILRQLEDLKNRN